MYLQEQEQSHSTIAISALCNLEHCKTMRKTLLVDGCSKRDSRNPKALQHIHSNSGIEVETVDELMITQLFPILVFPSSLLGYRNTTIERVEAFSLLPNA